MGPGTRCAMQGFIGSVGFASGDRFVIGHWRSSPIGPFTDVMWARPGGQRLLLVPSASAHEFVTGIYLFDRYELVGIEARHDPGHLHIEAGPLRIDVQAGWPRPIPFSGAAWFCRFVQGPIARAAMGVRTYGVTPTGVREWYRADSYRRVRAATALLDGRDLGPLAARIEPAVRFGISEPPRRPSLVAIRPLLQYPLS